MFYSALLEQKKTEGSFRTLANIDEARRRAAAAGRAFVNLGSNDYLGLGEDAALRREFWAGRDPASLRLGACSSRLLTGTCDEHEALEQALALAYGAEAALVFGSGYHANEGILPALCGKGSLLLADKLIHASCIDGMRLCAGRVLRYRHNDYRQLAALVEQHHAACETLWIVTESVFSMDGDFCDLTALTALKRAFPKVRLYVDEAHAVGVRGPGGLGCCAAAGCRGSVDVLMGTMSKAWASAGAFVVCTAELRDYLINTVRPFIFTTALPPVNLAWSRFILERMAGADMTARRQHLAAVSRRLHAAVHPGRAEGEPSQIVPVILGDNRRTLAAAEALQAEGFYVSAIRPPTVPAGTSRLRISLTAAVTTAQAEALARSLRPWLP